LHTRLTGSICVLLNVPLAILQGLPLPSLAPSAAPHSGGGAAATASGNAVVIDGGGDIDFGEIDFGDGGGGGGGGIDFGDDDGASGGSWLHLCCLFLPLFLHMCFSPPLRQTLETIRGTNGMNI
jgi:hypothetical protein